MNKPHCIYKKDGLGAANNERACVEHARSLGLRNDQYEIRRVGRDTNECQARGLYVSNAALRKVLARRRRAEAREYGEAS